MSDEETTAGEAGTGSTQPWLITPPPPPPPPAGTQPPEAGPPPSRTSVEETSRLPPVDPSAFEVPPVPPGPPEGPVLAEPTAVTPVVGESSDDQAPPSEPVLEPESTPPLASGTAAAGAPDEPGRIDDPTMVAAAATTESALGGDSPDAPSGAPGAPGASDRPFRRAATAIAGTTAAKAAMTELREQSAWVLGSAAILVAFAISWFAGILLSFRHARGFTARDRVLQFFEPGTLIWALAILLAVALITIARKFDLAPARSARMHEWLPAGLFLGGVSVTVSALVAVLIEFTNFGNGIDQAFAALIGYIGVLLVGAAATWWAFLELKARHEERKASG